MVNNDQKILFKNNLKPEDYEAIFSENFFKDIDRSGLMSRLEHGANAHITLALGPGAEARQAGVDLYNNRLKLEKINSSNNKFESLKLSNYEIFYFGDCFCYIKLNSPLYFIGIFTGEY